MKFPWPFFCPTVLFPWNSCSLHSPQLCCHTAVTWLRLFKFIFWMCFLTGLILNSGFCGWHFLLTCAFAWLASWFLLGRKPMLHSCPSASPRDTSFSFFFYSAGNHLWDASLAVRHLFNTSCFRLSTRLLEMVDKSYKVTDLKEITAQRQEVTIL